MDAQGAGSTNLPNVQKRILGQREKIVVMTPGVPRGEPVEMPCRSEDR